MLIHIQVDASFRSFLKDFRYKFRENFPAILDNLDFMLMISNAEAIFGANRSLHVK
jgi:hypothetical protein